MLCFNFFVCTISLMGNKLYFIFSETFLVALRDLSWCINFRYHLAFYCPVVGAFILSEKEKVML